MVMEISASGLRAQRIRMNTIAENVANAQVTRTAEGTPYRRKAVLFQAGETPAFSQVLDNAMDIEEALSGGVVVTDIVTDYSDQAFTEIYDPAHPHAIKEGPKAGIVLYPNINVVEEMVNLIDASRAYEANVTVITDFKRMAEATLRIGA